MLEGILTGDEFKLASIRDFMYFDANICMEEALYLNEGRCWFCYMLITYTR